MSIINDLIGGINNPEPKFYIYDNNYVYPSTAAIDLSDTGEIENDIIFSFTSLISIAYDKENTVTEQPLELGSFTADSTISHAPTLTLVVNYTPYASTAFDTDESLRLKVNTVIQDLKTYADGQDLLTVSMQNAPLYDVYRNLKLYGFAYEQTPQQTGFYATLKFKEIRFTTVEYGTLPQKRITNPANSSTVDRGQLTPRTPNSSVSGNF